MKHLPTEFVNYHRSGCPLEGDPAEIFPGRFQLWPPDEIDELNQVHEVDDLAPGFTGVGSDEGGEMIVLSPSGQVVALPFVGIEPSEATVVSESWGEFEPRIKP
jgi:hypothetical protein